ncbi:MAG: extracellular solute-binding protein [Spirochaetales bacterium]|nr:extracellular solute-binding protein [Spirochaetales bacterium]
MKKRLLCLFVLAALLTPMLFAGGKQEVESGPRTVTIEVWTREAGVNHWRADLATEAAVELNAQLKAEGSEVTVEVVPVHDEGDWGGFKKKYSLAADAGEAPLIICSGHEDIATWGQAGYIIPLADTVSEIQAEAPEFSDVFESLWNSATWRNQIWGVPQDTEARPMYFNKTLLGEMGWSDTDIAALPGKIEMGEFTLSDLISVASEAIDKGVVEPGYGYWHRPSKGGDFLQFYKAFGGDVYDAAEDKLVIDEEALTAFYAFQRECVTSGVSPDKYIGTEWKIWHDVVSNGKALFMNGGTWMWADWAANYAVGGEEALFENIGYAYQPSGVKGVKGTTLSHPLVYLISSESASDSSDQDLAMRLIALMSTTERNTRHAVESGHLGILNSQTDFDAYKESQFLADVTYLLDNNFYLPNHVLYGTWFDILWDGMVAAEQGEKSPEEAAADAVKLMKLEIEDQLIVR